MEDHSNNEISVEASVRDDSPTISDFRMRWFSIVVVLVMTLVMIGAVMIANPHHPQVQWPESEYAELRSSGSHPVSAEFLQELIKAYPTCVVGEKYGAICQDGEVSHDPGPDACSDNGGVKEWITCK